VLLLVAMWLLLLWLLSPVYLVHKKGVVVVTGSSTGIGRDVALSLTEEGCCSLPIFVVLFFVSYTLLCFFGSFVAVLLFVWLLISSFFCFLLFSSFLCLLSSPFLYFLLFSV